MLTREDILSSYKEVKFPDKFFGESISQIKNIIFYEKSAPPFSEKVKNTQKLSESYVLPRHILIQKNIKPTQNYKNDFVRSGNFTPKEPIIDIQIDNFKLIYDKFSLPLETNVIYLKNTYGGINGPYNLEYIKNNYKNKKIDSNNEFRLIDIFSFKDSELFSFQSLKIINDNNWVDLVIDNPLINYSDLFKNKKKENEEKKEIINEIKEEEKEIKVEKEIKEIEPKILESEGKWEVTTKKKKKKIKSKEIKEEKLENIEKEEKNDKKEIDSLEKLDIKINKEKKENKEELVEILRKKQKEKEKAKEIEKEKEENKIEENKIKENKNEEKKDDEKKEEKKENEIKEVRNKKGKKKKKGQFAETEIDLGFQVK